MKLRSFVSLIPSRIDPGLVVRDEHRNSQCLDLCEKTARAKGIEVWDELFAIQPPKQFQETQLLASQLEVIADERQSYRMRRHFVAASGRGFPDE